MNTDLYSKVIQTIIAVCLVILVINQVDLFPKAYANDFDQQRYGIVPINEDGSINVVVKKLEDNNMDVVIRGIKTYDDMHVSIEDINTSDKLNTVIKDIDVSSPDVLDVNIKKVGGFDIDRSVPIKE